MTSDGVPFWTTPRPAAGVDAPLRRTAKGIEILADQRIKQGILDTPEAFALERTGNLGLVRELAAPGEFDGALQEWRHRDTVPCPRLDVFEAH